MTSQAFQIFEAGFQAGAAEARVFIDIDRKQLESMFNRLDLQHAPPTIVDAARKVLASWDERGQEREQCVTSSVTGQTYWSPAASLVSSEPIAELRAALMEYDT